jgi:hypothetical protein
MIQEVEYKGWRRNLAISNADCELIITLDVGPRVISYRLPNGFNVMKNYEEMMGKSGEREWQIRGGHRFWLAPEDCTRTYFPDNRMVQYETVGTTVRFLPPPEEDFGIQKVMEITLADHGTRVQVRLVVTNIGDSPTTLAPWGPTVMAPGGMEIIPLPQKFNHPGSTRNAMSPDDFAPNQELILWPYFDFSDSRWNFGKKYIRLTQDAKKGPTKIGLAHRQGWVAYWNQGTVFVKRFTHHDSKTYPDRGTSYQTFSNEDMLEMETVGALRTLLPGQSTELFETWELFGHVPAVKTEDEIDQHILPLITR